MSTFYIMKAHHLTSSGRKLSLDKIIRDTVEGTILVADRHVGWSKKVRSFIIGAHGDYGVKPGDTEQYIVDTGMGYKGNGELDIIDVLQVRNGEIISGGTDHENAYTWVMK
jgi:hypothetical protein